MFEYQEDKPLANLFNVQPTDYEDITVASLPFSVRVSNRLREKKIRTLKDLLLVDIESLKKIRGFGANSINEILKYCGNLPKSHRQVNTENNTPFSSVFIENLDSIIEGDFSFADSIDLSDEQKDQLVAIKDSYSILGSELARQCVESPKIIKAISLALSKYITQLLTLNTLKELCSLIPEFRRNNKAKYFIDVFSSNNSTKELITKCYNSVDDKLESILYSIDTENKSIVIMAEKFLQWCAFDLSKEIEKIFETIYSPRIQTVLEGRANNLTLNELGNQLHITRERVRQIESKGKRLFNRQLSKVKILPKLYADSNGQSIIKLKTIEEISGNNATTLIYLLKETSGGRYTYDEQLDVFYFGENDLSSRIQDYIDTLPDVIKKRDISKILNTAQEEWDLDVEYVEKTLFDVYSITGDVLHRSRLSLASIYLSVIKKYYPNGIHVYDDKEIEALRRFIINEYGSVNLPSANRAIAVRITDICILAGRGIYIPKKEKYISDELAKHLFSYIMENNSPILLLSSIYSVFEVELQSEGIDNRYYLQGILREIYGDKLYFRRDYVSREPNFTSIYSTIVSYIKSSKYPVEKEELKREFEGITDIVISFATSDNDILNYFGKYMHSSNLVISENEKKYLSVFLDKLICDDNAHHIKDIYSIINNDRPEIFQRNAAVGSFSAFSILEYLFRDRYQFARPYIAHNDVEIGRPKERLLELLYSKDVFPTSDITEFAKENHMQITSLIEFLNMLNDKYLLLDKTTLASIDEIGVDIRTANEVEMLINDEISNTTPIRDLKCVSRFPQINYPWNEWLLYSVLNKWSSKLEVALSASQLQQSIPLVSPKGIMDISKYKDYDATPMRINIDNMEDIDDLLADIISDEMLEDL